MAWKISSSNLFFAKIFTNARVKSIVFFGFVQYLPTPELEIFVGIDHWRQSQEHERNNKKGKKKNKFLAILDKTSNAVCLR
jgi:hypothetical protein